MTITNTYCGLTGKRVAGGLARKLILDGISPDFLSKLAVVELEDEDDEEAVSIAVGLTTPISAEQYLMLESDDVYFSLYTMSHWWC